ncbi:DUF3995 domain-containing protein [Paenibacillus ginsengarvi]|uniref:DUF3995 domain-containing protein n=1 Tax=Paenibacillus ginsengarvi TaxID=400777 RepID=A0A3B0C3R8_9BACL|nr:DUF3995 domain-containing protein [Paenibacillus ginsengarvi]RKN80633.1 DUF3995 domain-containing protein [Paenibacillus ginsengarvi]
MNLVSFSGGEKYLVVNALSILAACILFTIGVLHIYWGLGGKKGLDAAIPRDNGKRAFSPGAGATFAVAVLVLLAGVLLLLQAGVVRMAISASLVRLGALGCAAVFALRVVGDFRRFGLFKQKSETVFSKMDTWLYVPLCAFLSIVYGIAVVQ